MNYFALNSVPSSTNGVLPNQNRTAKCASQNGRRAPSTLSGAKEQDAAGNLSQYSAPAAALYEALLVTAAATSSQQASAGFENLSATTTQASLYAAAALACVPVKVSDNYFTQPLRNDTLVSPHRAETRDCHQAVASSAGAMRNTSCVNASPARYVARVHPSDGAPEPDDDKLHFQGGERLIDSVPAPTGATAGKIEETSAEQNVISTTSQWHGSFTSGTNANQNRENACDCVRQNTSKPVTESLIEAREDCSGSPRTTEALGQASFAQSLFSEARAAVAAVVNPHGWNQIPLGTTTQQQDASDGPRSARPSSQRRPTGPQSEQSSASEGVIRANQCSSAASGGGSFSGLQQEMHTSSNFNSPAKIYKENTSKLVLPRRSQSRASLFACCWETGKYPYPDACTPRMWNGKIPTCVEAECDAATHEACCLRSLHCVSSPNFVSNPSPTFPDSTRCSKVEMACCDIPHVCRFTVSPESSPGLSRGCKHFHRAGGSASDLLALARGRDSAASFCKITLEEAVGDGLCNPHHELQSLSDVLRGEEGSPGFMPTLLLTSELRGTEEFCQAPGSLDPRWHNGPLPGSGVRSTSPSLSDTGCCAATCNSPDVPTTFLECRRHLATPPHPSHGANSFTKSQTCLPEGAASTNARPRTLLPSKTAPSFLSDVTRDYPNLSSPPIVAGSNLSKETVTSPAISPIDNTSCLSAVLPENSVFDTEIVSARKERTISALDIRDSSSNVFQETMEQMCPHQVTLDMGATTLVQTPSAATEDIYRKVTSSTRASRSVVLQLEGFTEAQTALECSRVCVSITNPPERTPLCIGPGTVHSGPRSEHLIRNCASELRSYVVPAPSTLSSTAQDNSPASTWHTEYSSTTFSLTTDSSVVYSCPTTCHPLRESCWTQKTGAASRDEAIRKEDLVRVQDIAEEEAAKEGNGGFSADVSTAPSVCGSGSCSTSPLTPPQGSPATALPAARTTTTLQPPFLEQSNFALPPPNISCVQEGGCTEQAARPCADRFGSIYGGGSSELEKRTMSNSTDSHNLLSHSSPCENSKSDTISCNKRTVDYTATSTASIREGESNKVSPSQQFFLCPTAGPRGLPTAPKDVERRPQIKNNLNRLKVSALPSASFADSPNLEHTGLQFPQYAAAVAGSCCSRTASESVPTPTTAGHSTQSPVAFSPLSSEGDTTTGNGNTSTCVGACSSGQQDVFSVASNDGCRGTPSSINGCVASSTAATALHLIELFSGKDRDTSSSETADMQAPCSLSCSEAADTSARSGVAIQRCSIPSISTTTPTADTTGMVDPPTTQSPLSTDECISTAAAITSNNEVLLIARQTPVDAIVCGQPNASVVGKSASEPVAADECSGNVYKVEHPPPELQTSESGTAAAPQAAHGATPSVKNLKTIAQENKLETFKYVLAGSEPDLSQCAQYSGNLLQQQLAASLLSNDLTQTYQQWWFSNSKNPPCRQQQNAACHKQASGHAEYSEASVNDPFACSGRPSASGKAGREQLVMKYAHHCETNETVVGKLPLAASVGRGGPYPLAEEELIEYEEHWDGAHGSAFELGDAGPTAVPVRTRKGFRKPLPLPQEMLVCPGHPGDSEKGNEPVLQYDVSSREWRVFWVEGRLARYKVFQAKKFGKERAQQLAEEWYQRARAGDVSGSGRGVRAGVRTHVNPKSKKLRAELQ